MLKVLEQMPSLIKEFEGSLQQVSKLLKVVMSLEKNNLDTTFTNWRVQKQYIVTSLAVTLLYPKLA